MEQENKLYTIDITFESRAVGSCSYIYLQPYSKNTKRRILLYEVRLVEEVRPFPHEIIELSVSYFSREGYFRGTHRLEVELFEFADDLSWIYGPVIDHSGGMYEQDVLDFYRAWSTNKPVNWYDFPYRSDIKQAYFMACFQYSGVPSAVLKKDIYLIDLSRVKEAKDFIYELATAFFGERAFLGWSWYSTCDVLFEVNRSAGYAEGAKIIFSNMSIASTPDEPEFYTEVHKALVICGYLVEVQS